MDIDQRAQRNTEEPQGSADAGSDQQIPIDAVPLVPMRNVVLFPVVITPITVGRERSIAAAQYALRHEKPIGVILQKESTVELPGPEDLYQIGTVATVLRYVTAPDGSHHLVCQGEERFRAIEFLDGYPFLVARIERIPERDETTPEIEACIVELKLRVSGLLRLSPQAPAEFASAMEQVTSPSALADLTATFVDVSLAEKQEILETFDLKARLEKILQFVTRRLQVVSLTREISEQTKQSMDERQRKFLLQEQLKTIQKELGETDEHAAEIAELAEAIAKAQMPEDVEAQARQELKRLERMPEASGEYSIIRTYLDWLIELPWKLEAAPPIEIGPARKILDEDHYGLEKIKRRILEYLAVRKLKPDGKSPILCFVGPPGVGKTSLGQSIAKATGRAFSRVSLGGVHDEAEIRGHRRTYIGALPGNIIQAIRKAGTRDCVMMLDEMDKLGAGFHGDPSAALLEVLDPEQNVNFRDNYLGVPFDLSHVMFIGTANQLDTIPVPLRDRMEMIPLPGYTEEDKLQIAHRYLVGRQLDACGLTSDQCEITDAALQTIIRDYTREAGVRNLEREIGAVFRHCAMQVAEGRKDKVRIDVGDLHAILGPARFESEVAMRTSVPGVATGLAWTPAGGDILFIEASRVPGSGKLILTGQLGEVMKESAQAALSLVKARLGGMGVGVDTFEKADIHVHVPAGATPKDGPSAGVAIYVALFSLLVEKPVRSDVAMTGEISLRGLVLPVGGIKEKVLAALRAGISTVMLPARNHRELEDIPQEARDKLSFIWLEKVEDAISAAIGEIDSQVR
jgi:ATP-dependent Lon protease